MADEDVDIEAPVTRKSLIMPNLPKILSLDEKKYLLAIERGDLANVRRMLQKAQRKKSFDINCMDSLGRGALTISIDQENLEMVELLVVMGVETKDALLHAINVEFVEAVELLLEYEELIHKEGEPYSWQKVDINTAMFTPDITPLILAAHRNNYEILKILLDRGATVPMPHDIKCGCDECIRQSEEDSLRHSLSRLNEYRALASASLIALSSSDPLLTAFQLSWELRSLASAEPECKSDYLELRKQCQQFAVDLLHQSRSSQELAIILNHDPDNPPYEQGEHMKLARLELAIQYKQKKFVAHPNIQQLLAALWYEGVPGFRRKSSKGKIGTIVKVALLFPLYCVLYMIAPETKTGKLMRKPFMKFLIHASSYLFFLLLLILVSQRAEDQLILFFGTESMKQDVIETYQKQRGNPPTFLEYAVLLYVLGLIAEETEEILVEGIESYLRNLWNFIDFTRNLLYTFVVVLRVAAYIQQAREIREDPSTAYIKREEWKAFDPQLIAEGLFAAANIFSALKLVHLFSINPHLGPLQISLGRMVIDIVKFFFIYSLVLFAFACGLNQLLWYFSDLERGKCYHLNTGEPDFDNSGDACMKWRRFANVFESSQSLFWASFGLVDLSSFELTGIKTYTRFWGLLMFGSYSVINVIVLLNLLIAMMSNSYAMIDEQSDTEWKFARTKLWMSYFDETGTLPPPFNIFPKPKNFFKLLGIRKKDKMRRMSSKRRNREERERDYRYTAVMRSLVWRYVSAMHRKCEESLVTEDDVNELKSDISSFRYEMLEVLSKNGMDISCAERKEKAVLGKKMKVWERRLMKDFKVAPIATEEDEELIYEAPPEGENSLAKFRRIAKLAVLNSSLNKWRQVVKGVCIASQIGHCHSRDSFKKQQNLQKAMEEAKRLVVKSPTQSRATTPIQLPDMTGSNIVQLVRDVTPDEGGNEVSISPAPITILETDDKSRPAISICPPPLSPILKKPMEKSVADLINLESEKNSPVLPIKAKNITDTNLSDEDKTVDINQTSTPPPDQNKTDLLDKPPSPTSSTDKSLDSDDKRVIGGDDIRDDIGPLSPTSSPDKSLDSGKKSPISLRDYRSNSESGQKKNEDDVGFQDSDNLILERAQSVQENEDEKEIDKEQKIEVKEDEEATEIEDAAEAILDGNEEEQIKEDIGEVDTKESLDEEPTEDSEAVVQEIEDIITKPDSQLDVLGAKVEIENKALLTPQPQSPRRSPSPMAQRNIQRVQDKKIQPKYGWI